MTRTRYTMPARSQGKLCTQRQQACLAGKDVHRWLTTRLDNFYCDLQVMYMPHVVLNNTLPLHAMARIDEARMVDARGLTPRGAVKALVKATGLNPHLSVCGWPFCLDDVKRNEVTQ